MYRNFIHAAIVRAVRTVAQTAISVIGVSYAMADVDWLAVVSASVLAGVVSVLTSIVTGLPEVDAAKKDDDCANLPVC